MNFQLSNLQLYDSKAVILPILIITLAANNWGGIACGVAGAQGPVERQTGFDQALPLGRGGSLRVENASGSIRVRLAKDREARVMASVPAGVQPGEWISVETGDTPPGSVLLRIPATSGKQIDIEVTLPGGIFLYLETDEGSIDVGGPVAGLVANSRKGSIRVELSPDHDADLSLLSVSGTIRCEVPTTLFGRFDSHHVQAKVGRGGSAILVRTQEGGIEVVPSGSEAGRLSENVPGPIADDPGSSRASQTPVMRTSGEPEAPDRSVPSGTGNMADEKVEVKLEAPLVNLNVSVTDRSGRAIPDLVKGDFQVYEDGVQQVIKHLSATSAPFDLILLLDLSGSIEKKIKLVKEAAKQFVDLLGPQDRVGVYTFRSRVQAVSHLTNDRTLLKRRIDRIGGGRGGTAFYDALWFTIEELERSSNNRRAIVVMTDGVDNSISDPENSSPRHSFEVLLERVVESEMFIYPIYLDTEYEMVVRRHRENSESYAVARLQLRDLADQTAGVLFKAAQVEDLESVYQHIADELRTVYSLAYEPTNTLKDGTWRRIRVRVNQPDSAVRTRRGYYAR